MENTGVMNAKTNRRKYREVLTEQSEPTFNISYYFIDTSEEDVC